MMRALWQDVRYGVRTLTNSKGFTFVAVLTLALVIGASVAILSVFNAVLLHPLPYPDAERVVAAKWWKLCRNFILRTEQGLTTFFSSTHDWG